MEILFIIVGIVIGLALGYFVSKTKSVKEISALKERKSSSTSISFHKVMGSTKKPHSTALFCSVGTTKVRLID